ncbi:MAG: cation:proton antiporter [Candidatus Micrarchaeia archaeon]|jgi:cell volume regulation protein A
MIETLIAFALISGIIFAGFIGEMLFRKLGIPGVLLLLALGYMLGPVTHGLDVEMLKSVGYIVGPLALVVLLFDGGMRMNIFQLIHGGGRGVLMAVLVTILSILAVTGIWVALGYDPLMGAVLGAILGGTTSTMVVSIVSGLKMSDEARQFVLIDAALTDVLAVILTIALMSIVVTHNASVQGTGKEILGSFSTGAVIGGLIGLAWIALSKKLRQIDFFYMVTLAIILIAYMAAEYFGGSGAIAALVIGIMLGNYKEIGQMLKFKDVADDAELLTFQNEFGFLVRSFYFVYLGSMVVIGSAYSIVVGGAMMLGLAVARFLSTRISTWGSPISKYSKYINAFMPRGLAAAVMGGYPAVVLLESQGTIPPEVFAPLYAQAELFVEIAFVVIILSVVLTAVGAVLLRRGEAKGDKEQQELEKEVEERLKKMGRNGENPEPEGGPEKGSETSGD